MLGEEGKYMKITKEMTEAAYSYSQKVYNGLIEKNDALDHLTNVLEMNRNSAADLINNFKYMMDGKKYTRTNNEYTTDYFLKQIYSDYGRQKLRKALFAVDEHLKYYEALRSTNLHGIRKILENYKVVLSKNDGDLYPDEIPVSEKLLEGIKKQVTVNSFERNPKARQECIDHFGTSCYVCDFNFQKIYGDIGAEFIHVHHLTQLSTIGQEYEINPIEELRPVCPNCHSMLHRKIPPYTIDELKEIMKTPNKRLNPDAG